MTSVKGRNVFISGPMTGMTNYNAGAFAEAHAKLKLLGASGIYDPVQEWFRDGEEYEHEEYVRRCLAELTGRRLFQDELRPRYDVLVQLPYWEDSPGAHLEAIVAEAIGMDVASIEEVVA